MWYSYLHPNPLTVPEPHFSDLSVFLRLLFGSRSASHSIPATSNVHYLFSRYPFLFQEGSPLTPLASFSDASPRCNFHDVIPLLRTLDTGRGIALSSSSCARYGESLKYIRITVAFRDTVEFSRKMTKCFIHASARTRFAVYHLFNGCVRATHITLFM